MPSTESAFPGDEANEYAISDALPSELGEALSEALYTAVGLGVLAVNRLQVARREILARRPDTANDGSAGGSAAGLLSGLDEEVARFERRLTPVLDEIDRQLPASARPVFGVLRQLASDQAVQLKSVLGLTVTDPSASEEA